MYNKGIMQTTTQKVFKNSFLPVFTISFIILFFTIFTAFDPSTVVAQTYSTSTSVVVTLNVTAGIAITDSANVTMSRNLSMTNMTAIASSTWTVTTNNITGYNLTVKASTAPAMQQNATTTVADFATTTTALWSTVPSGAAQFGFSAYGTDVTDSGSWGTGTDCQSAAHIPSTTLKYSGFMTSTSTVVATRSATTTFAGSATTVCYAVEQKAFYIPSGTYTATITATAVTI